jgi:hypothetical protein
MSLTDTRQAHETHCLSPSVSVHVIPAAELLQIGFSNLVDLSDQVIELLTPLTHKPGFIGFCSNDSAAVSKILDGPTPSAEFFYAYRSWSDVRIAAIGQVREPLLTWDRRVYDAYGQMMFQIPLGVRLVICPLARLADRTDLLKLFYNELTPSGA